MLTFDDETISNLFGAEDAENEYPERLKEYFFRNKAYESLKADLPIRVVVGYKGVGKSALLKICHLEDLEDEVLSLWVRPNDVFGNIDTKANSFLQLIENWKTGLSTLIVRKALEGCNLYEDASTVSKIQGGARQLISVLYAKLQDAAGTSPKDSKKLIENFLRHKKVRIYLDDLDRGWEGRPEDIKNISALLNAIRDMAGDDRNVQFRIGLRTDVYHLVRTSDESTDKIEGNLVWLSWNNHEILATLVKRVTSFLGDSIDQQDLVKLPQEELARKLDPVIEHRFHGRGKWANIPTRRILMTLTRKRPRDLVKLFYYSAKEAHSSHSGIITSGHLQNIFVKYSNERLTDIVNEFKTEVPNLKDVFLTMRQTRKEKESGIGPIFDDGQLVSKMKTAIQSGQIFFTNGDQMSPIALARFLYRSDFVTARMDMDSGIVRKHFSDNQLLAETQAQFGFKWEIHPAYRWALDPQRDRHDQPFDLSTD
ncbi:P-loop ATPase, Sll1717 family [Tritonibacter mobilis]|uniref:P-loop ATPase, Sll1717 family n=1 Tax=Tritonibacter mobilis TaxID=379347 RepID=UPI00080698C1|nr:hypothetical protein [Tritonibacter mobilis]GLP86528.1 hypothetical protein GCM10007921_20880 [Tritonibacter mobilis]SDX78069.1 hypothetical protein SAMN05444385_11342 [Tritonibacter mobilis]